MGNTVVIRKPHVRTEQHAHHRSPHQLHHQPSHTDLSAPRHFNGIEEQAGNCHNTRPMNQLLTRRRHHQHREQEESFHVIIPPEYITYNNGITGLNNSPELSPNELVAAGFCFSRTEIRTR